MAEEKTDLNEDSIELLLLLAIAAGIELPEVPDEEPACEIQRFSVSESDWMSLMRPLVARSS